MTKKRAISQELQGRLLVTPADQTDECPPHLWRIIDNDGNAICRKCKKPTKEPFLNWGVLNKSETFQRGVSKMRGVYMGVPE